MNEPRYVLHPGYVGSRHDGDEHFIGGPRLARLYGVDIRLCVFGDEPGYREHAGDVHLRPRFDGDYTLTQAREQDQPPSIPPKVGD